MSSRHHVFQGLPADPFLFWRRLHKNPRHGFILGSGAALENDHLMFLSAGEPVRIFKSDGSNDVLIRIQRERKKVDSSAPRFVGFLGFESGRLFDPALRRWKRPSDPLKLPAQWFGDFREVVKLDFKRAETTLLGNGTGFEFQKWIRRTEKALRRKDLRTKKKNKIGDSKFKIPSKSRFIRMVRRAKDFIAAGEIYQANLSLRFEKNFSGDPLALYERLCRLNPSPYACLLKIDSKWLVSCSPELLLSVHEGRAVTRPIAGTRPRGKKSAEDRRRQGALLLSPKERAEHIMLVDLERNDLGRVCRPGSVRVTETTGIEKYSHVMHIVSQVEGRLLRGKTAADALRALFPGGTITGCPKIRSIEIIEGLEPVLRGPFYGSAGFFRWNGDAVFNILIRTALLHNETLTIQAGAGIVADSNADREYREVLAKAQALIKASS